jgi:hypothetical protein
VFSEIQVISSALFTVLVRHASTVSLPPPPPGEVILAQLANRSINKMYVL